MRKSLLVLLVSFLLFISGCQINKADVLKDDRTKEKLDTVELSKQNIIIRVMNDAMLGFEDYSNKDLVVDLEYFSKFQMSRGDIVYFEYPEHIASEYNGMDEKQILRVVGLSGEKISMRKGQIFVNGNKLDAFYGTDLLSIKQLKKSLKNKSLLEYEKENIKNAIRFIEQENLDEVDIPEGMIFLLGDNRSRALDSVMIGPVSNDHVIGKVIGQLANH